ncbi:hypothetical protein [Rhodococcus sp. NPDC049939]|uniref:hypothetical protein n=1 Tax=Rhodococcus sp. NPDC049939 TaxID=3155511 RepID=UPI00340DFAFA
MTNPDDPHTPQERANDGTEPSTGDETTSAQPEQAHPTEHIGSPEQHTEHVEGPEGRGGQFSTPDPTVAYGQNQPNPTQAFPTYDPRFDQQAPPPNPTQAYPVNEAQQYQGGYPSGQYPQGPYPHASYQGPPYPPYPPGQYPNDPPGQYPDANYRPPRDEGPEEKKSLRIGTWIAATTAVLLLLAVIGFSIALVTSTPNNSSTTVAGPTTTSTAPSPPSPAPGPNSEPPSDQIPGGSSGALVVGSAAFGRITDNDGSTLTLDTIGGGQLTVYTNADTRVFSLDGSTVADLRPGVAVIVRGTEIRNGEMTALTIVSTQLPRYGGN